MEGLFSEHIAKKSLVIGDIDNQETARVKMGAAHKVAFTVAVPSVAEDLVFTMRQHDAASAGNSKDLVVVNDLTYKLIADAKATKVDAPETAQVTVSQLNGQAGHVVVEINAEDLDVNNGFAYVSLQVADLTNARVGYIEAESHMPRLKPAREVEL